MRIKKSRLLQIISEEIERDVISEESDIERIDRWKSVLDDKDPQNDNKYDKEEGFKDFKKGRALVQKMLDQIDQFGAIDTKGLGPEEEGTIDADHLAEFVAAIPLSLGIDAAKSYLSSSGVPAPYDQIMSAGLVIVTPIGATFQIFDPGHWRSKKDGSTTPLPLPGRVVWKDGEEKYGCEIVARSLVAGIIYKSIYEVYGKFGTKLIASRLGTLLGRRRMPIISLLSPERLKVVISIAVTAKIMRLDDGNQISEAIKNIEQSICKIDSFRSAVEEVISLGESLLKNTPGAVKAVVKDLQDSLQTVLPGGGGTTGGGSGNTTGTTGGGGSGGGSGGGGGGTDAVDGAGCPAGKSYNPVTGNCE